MFKKKEPFPPLVYYQGLTRKYTGEPYANHALRVAELVRAELPNDTDAYYGALLHDVLEDVKCVTPQRLRMHFSRRVVALVKELTTDVPDVSRNRRQRKELECQHFLRATNTAKTIKLADILDNISDIAVYDKNFASVYLREKREILPYLEGGSKRLHKRVSQKVESILAILAQVKQ